MPSLPWSGTFVTESVLTQHDHQKSMVYFEVLSPVVHSVDLDKCMMTCPCHWGTIQSAFPALNILCVLPLHLLTTPTPGIHWPFYCLHHLLFPECPIVGIIQ